MSASAFISYSRDDSEFALRLAKDLKAAGAHVWLDQLDIKPGHPWDNAIEDALTDAPQMLVILSPASSKSQNVRDEIDFALRGGKIVIPILYIECVIPLRLGRTQRIDFRADYARGLAALLDHLRVANPDPAILQQAAADDAQRQTAWQAREAERRRLEGQSASEISSRRTVWHAISQPWRWQKSSQAWLAGGVAVATLLTVGFIYKHHHSHLADADAQGEAMYGAGRFSDAVPLFTSSCNAGNAAGCADLGSMYLSGTYLVEDYKKAFDLSKTACDHGASLGCKNLGYIFEIGGGGISVDYTQSRSYYQKRCDAEPKDKESCYAITRLKSASNPPFDLQALRLLTEGCDGNNKDDCNTLGTIYESGKPNVTQDSNQALLLFSQACKLGSAAGCSDLGDLYHHGHGVPTNLDLAFKFLQKGCDMGNSWACGEAKALQ